MPITPRRLWSSPWTGPRFASPCRRPTPPADVSGAIPFAKSKISGTQRFSSPITTWAPVPRRRAARTPRQDLAPDRGDGRSGRGQRDVAHRVPGVLHRLSRAGGTGQGSRDPGSAVRRSAGNGHRRGLERSRVQRNGLEFDRPGRRIAKLAEVVSFIKAHWEARNWTTPATSFRCAAMRAGPARCNAHIHRS